MLDLAPATTSNTAERSDHCIERRIVQGLEICDEEPYQSPNTAGLPPPPTIPMHPKGGLEKVCRNGARNAPTGQTVVDQRTWPDLLKMNGYRFTKATHLNRDPVERANLRKGPIINRLRAVLAKKFNYDGFVISGESADGIIASQHIVEPTVRLDGVRSPLSLAQGV